MGLMQRVTCSLPDGAEGARTPDLLGAIQALSQLSYSPDGRLNLETAPPTGNPCKLTSVPLLAGHQKGRQGRQRGRCISTSAAHAASAPLPPYICPMRPVAFTFSGS